MTLSGIMEHHRRSIMFLVLALAVFGVAAALRVPVALFPQVSFPRVVVGIEAGDRPAERMAIEVTRPVEEAIRSIPGVRDVRSRTSRGAAELSVAFAWGDDMTTALLQVQTALASVASDMPAGVTVDVERMDPTVFPVLGWSLQSDTLSLVELKSLALDRVRPALFAIDGVADVAVLGGDDAELSVEVDPVRLAAHDLAADDVADAISAFNAVRSAGRIEQQGLLFLVLTDERIEGVEDIADIVIRADDAGVVRVRDVADVRDGVAPRWTRVAADGAESVVFQIYQQPDANTVSIARDAETALDTVRGTLPDGVRIVPWYDQSELIVASATSVRDAILIGVCLAALVFLAFLRDVRATAVAVVVVGASLSATCLVLSVAGMSFNVMSLGGMAAAVGLVIDDAIVVVEHLSRRLAQAGPHRVGVYEAAAEFTRPLLASSMGTVVIFVPLAWVPGVTGAFFRALSLTMVSALVVSFFVSWLGVPVLVALLGTATGAGEAHVGHPSRLSQGYAATMRVLLRRPLVSSVLLALPLVLAGVHAAGQVGSGFMPSIDEGGFVLDYHAGWGTSLEETDRMVREVEAVLRDTPEVSSMSRRTGVQLGGALTEANEGDFFVHLTPMPRRDLETIMDDVRQRVELRVPGLEIEMALLMEDLIGDLLGVPQPIEVKLYGDDEAALQQAAFDVAAALAQIEGVVDVEDGQVIAGNAMVIDVDAEAAAREGLAVEDVVAGVGALLDGTVATEVQRGERLVGVRVALPDATHMRPSQIERLALRAPDGHLVPVARIASLRSETGQPQILRENTSRMTSVTARLSGRDLGSAVQEVTSVLTERHVLPDGVSFAMGGLFAEQREAMRNMLLLVCVASGVLFLLLLFVYEQVAAALSALVAALLSLPAVLVGLQLTGTELNLTAMMGMVMIVGMASEFSIFYLSDVVDHFDDTGVDALIDAGRHRTRPIAMMKAAAVLSLAPLALGLGAGDGMLTPMAVAIISGLLVQLPIGVVLLPCLYATLRRRTS